VTKTLNALCRNCGANLDTVTFCPSCGLDFVRDRVDEELKESYARDWMREEHEMTRRVALSVVVQKARRHEDWKTTLKGILEQQKITEAEVEDALKHAEAGEAIDFRSAHEVALERIFLGDFQGALALARPAAEDGDPQAQHLLGSAYLEGAAWGLTEDPQEAASWFKKAANQNYAPSQYQLGVLYYEGSGVPQNRKEAKHLLRKASAQGLALAECKLGAIYYEANDERAAFMWFERAASRDYSVAQFNVGMMYEIGLGVDRDREQAEYWWQKAADQGYPEAIEKLKQTKKA
jgi:TPR repeat protein